MEHIVDLLKRHGIDDIVVTVAFMANTIRNYFGDGAEFGVKMVYATEESPLGTAGSVRNAMEHLTERFVVISGDVLTDIDLGQIIEFHDEKKALATIGLAHVENPLEFGIVITEEDGRIERFLEKPTWGQVFSDTINTGIFVLEPEIFDYIEADKPVDFSGEVFPRILDDGGALFGATAEGYWEDVGTLEAYLRAHKDILDGKVHVEIPGFELTHGVWLGEGADMPRWGPMRSSARTCVSGSMPTSSELWSTTTPTSAKRSASVERWWVVPAICAKGFGPRKVSCSVTSASSVRTRCSPRV